MTAKKTSVFTVRVAFALCLLGSLVLVPQLVAAGQQKVFETVEAASAALIQAAEDGDAAAMIEIFGPDGIDLVKTGDPVLDRNQAAEFAAEARIKTQLVWNPEHPEIVTLEVGADDWPLPIPIVNDGGAWRFDTEAGRQEILFRRIGKNELVAIEVCLGYVEAQYEYAQQKHGDSRINQYAQNIISTPGTRDGLAWQTEDGTWEGPVGEGIARVIAEGYTERYTPYHGYYFKVLTGQGPAAPMGKMDFVVEGVMIGGFALAAAPADYEVTGVMTFIVSHNGIVYEKDLGPETVELFRSMERYNPDDTWEPDSETAHSSSGQ
jgi:hypothetical protein